MNDIVSIIIPTYGRADFLSRAIKSVINQTYKNIEIIVVDDNDEGSEARFRTEGVMNQFQTLDYIKYIQNPKNLGGALSRNRGVESTNASFISFLDDDDVYEPEKIEKQIAFLKENKDIDVCYCGMEYVNQEGTKIGKRNIFLSGGQKLIKNHIFRPITGTPALLMKRKVFLAIGGFENLKRLQDANLIFKLLANNYQFSFLKSDYVKVYIHQQERISTSGNRDKLELEYFENNLKMLHLLSYNNSLSLIDKYHIMKIYCLEKNKGYFAIRVLKKLKLRLFRPFNFLTVLNLIVRKK